MKCAAGGSALARLQLYGGGLPEDHGATGEPRLADIPIRVKSTGSRSGGSAPIRSIHCSIR